MTTRDPKASGIGAGVGSSRGDFANIDLEGNTEVYDAEQFDVDDLARFRKVGCHQQNMAGLNVLNADPDWHYQWVRDDESSHRHATIRGLRPVHRSEDQERSVESARLSPRSTPNDTLERFNELVLYKMPMKAYREYQESLARKSEQQLYGAEANLTSGISDVERRYATRGPSRFRRSDHRTEVVDSLGEGARTHTQWTPDKGIIDEG